MECCELRSGGSNGDPGRPPKLQTPQEAPSQDHQVWFGTVRPVGVLTIFLLLFGCFWLLAAFGLLFGCLGWLPPVLAAFWLPLGCFLAAFGLLFWLLAASTSFWAAFGLLLGCLLLMLAELTRILPDFPGFSRNGPGFFRN